MRTVPAMALSALLVTVGGCADEDGDTARREVVVRDSAGITIVDNGPLGTSHAASPTLLVEIGVVEGDERYQLYRVSDAKRLSDGGFAVANAGSRELRIYNGDGTHRATAGGRGEGPSEFGFPAALLIRPGDTIQVQDFIDRVDFSPDGEFVRRTSTDRQAFADLWSVSGGMSEGGQWMADGTFFAPVYHWDQGPPTPGPPYRPPMTFVRVAPDLASVDTLGEYGGILQQNVDVGGPRGVTSIVPPFSTNTWWALGSGDGTVVAADNEVPQLDRYHPDGTRSFVRWDAETEPITSSDVDAWKDRRRNASWTQSRLPELERGWAAMDIPSHRPFFDRVAAGTDGAIWAATEEYEGGDTEVLRFDPDGRFAGRFTLPGRFWVFDSGEDWVLGVRRDENDVEFLQLLEVQSRR